MDTEEQRVKDILISTEREAVGERHLQDWALVGETQGAGKKELGTSEKKLGKTKVLGSIKTQESKTHAKPNKKTPKPSKNNNKTAPSLGHRERKINALKN